MKRKKAFKTLKRTSYNKPHACLVQRDHGYAPHAIAYFSLKHRYPRVGTPQLMGERVRAFDHNFYDN